MIQSLFRAGNLYLREIDIIQQIYKYSYCARTLSQIEGYINYFTTHLQISRDTDQASS